MKLINILYEISLWLLGLLTLPWLMYQMLFQGKYRNSFMSKCGTNFPHIDKGARRLIWVHAISMGETKAVAALCRELKAAPDNPILVITSATETGHAEAKRVIPEADYHVYLPFDFYALITPIVKRTAPNLVILSEGDYWYNFLRAAKKTGAKIVVVNGKISERSKSRYGYVPAFARALFSTIDLFCLQSEHFRKRFAELGIPDKKMVVTGNLKFDDSPKVLSDADKAKQRVNWGIDKVDPVVVIGSSHDPEEQQLLKVIGKVWNHFGNLKVIIVPRHPERFNKVAELMQAQNIPFVRHTGGPAANTHHRVVLVDAMGLLRDCYQLADVAIVAGSYTNKVGGHNILEPLWFGVPTLYGPYMHSQPELDQLAKEYGACLQLSLEDLEGELIALLEKGAEAARLRESGQNFVKMMQGSTQRTLSALSHL